MIGTCVICLEKVDRKYGEMHFLFEDSLYSGYPLCDGCYDDCKDKIPDYVDCISKRCKIRDAKAAKLSIEGNLQGYF